MGWAGHGRFTHYPIRKRVFVGFPVCGVRATSASGQAELFMKDYTLYSVFVSQKVPMSSLLFSPEFGSLSSSVKSRQSSSSSLTLGGDVASEIMPSVRGVASEQATPVDEPKIYVAVGKDANENASKIFWTARQSGLGGNFKICVVHVLVPSRRIPIGGLGAGIPASSVHERVLREHRENERINVYEILDKCLLVCKRMGVRAEKEYIESDSVEKGIVELIALHGIRKLVMGAAADTHYLRRMTEIWSEKAIFVRDKAHISCHIWFICDGHLIHTREAQTVHAPSLTASSPVARKSSLSKSRSAKPKRSAMTKLSNPFQDIIRTFSWNTDPHYDKAEQSIPRHYDEVEVDIIQGWPKDPGKSLYSEELKEELEKEKDQLDQMMEKLRIAPALKSRLENQFEETDLSRKELELKIIESDEMLQTFRQERELLHINLEDAREKAEEVSRRSKGDSSGTRWRGCPRRLQVTNFPSGDLTILDLSWSKVTKDWEGWDQIEMQNLRVLDLTGCADLLVTPKFCGCKNLAILILERCSQLVKIDHSIGDLKCLVSLNLKFCTELSMLPGELGHLTALQELLMDGTLVQ